MNSKKNYVLPILMMIALFGMISFVTGLANPMGVIVKSQFEASNAMSQLGNLANFIAYAFMGIPAGLLLQKIGYKKTALIAIVVGFIGVGIQLLSGAAESFAVYLIGAFVAGFSMCMLNVVANPMLNTLGGGGKKGNQLIQIGGSFNSLNATIVPVLIGYLMGDVAKASIKDANPALLLAMGIFALVFIVLYFVNIPEPNLEKVQKSTEKSKYSALSFRHFNMGAIAVFVYVGVEVAIPNTVNLFLTDTVSGMGMNPTSAGSVVGTYWFLMLIGRLIGAAVGGKILSKTMLTFVSCLAMVFVSIAILSPTSMTYSMLLFQSNATLAFTEVPIGVMFLVLCGFCTSVMWGSIFNLAVEGLGRYTEAAAGIFMVMVCGGGIIPFIQNTISDHFSYMSSFWIVFAGFAYLLYYARIGSKNINKNIPVD